MRILVANLGSTSFKCRLFDVTEGGLVPLGKAGVERVTDYGAAIEEGLEQLRAAGAYAEGDRIEAVGFKTVLGHQLSGCVEADDACLAALEAAIPLAPAHNPAYLEGIRRFREKLPEARLVALFETAFYQWAPLAGQVYAVPRAWRELGLRRYGFHGASHKFIAERAAVRMGREDVAQRVRRLYADGPSTPLQADAGPLRVISCHLGGSSSVTGIQDGVAIGTSMGLSPQSGLPQNNRVGELDSGAVPFIHQQLGLPIEEISRILAKESGLFGLSEVSNDLRDIRAAAAAGNSAAQLAIDHFVHQIRHWIGSFWFAMGGCEALVFTAGIGENDAALRALVTRGLEGMGLVLDPAANERLPRETEGKISAVDSGTAVWVIPTNEEAVVATETFRLVSR